MKTKSVLYATTALLCGFGAATSAAVVAIGPFAGSLSETWESFPGGVWQPSPLPIMGGNATVSVDPPGGILPISSGSQSAGTSGVSFIAPEGINYAYVGAGSSATLAIAEIAFASPVRQFGAYFASFTGFGWTDPFNFEVIFKDAGAAIIDTVSFGYSHAAAHDGLFDWHGWQSTVPVKTVQVNRSTSGDAGLFVVDDLRANVPEPASVALLAGLSLVGFAGCRRLRRAGA